MLDNRHACLYSERMCNKTDTPKIEQDMASVAEQAAAIIARCKA